MRNPSTTPPKRVPSPGLLRFARNDAGIGGVRRKKDPLPRLRRYFPQWGKIFIEDLPPLGEVARSAVGGLVYPRTSSNHSSSVMT
jgi:hypothetical protein